MRNRWGLIGALTLGLFAINVATRLVAREALSQPKQDKYEVPLGILFLAVTALVCLVVTFVRARRVPAPVLAGEIGLAILLACALTLLVGPYLVDSTPFADGVGLFFRQGLFYFLVVGGGAALGLLLAMMLGLDWKGQSWKRQEQRLKRRPTRTIRGR